MKKITNCISISITRLLLLVLILFISLPFLPEHVYQAATSYSNAKEFYESTGKYGKSYHAEMTNGTIYYATSAKLASSSSALKYRTIGFDITLSGNGHTLSFTIQRDGGSMAELNSRKTDTHSYNLYAITDETLYHLAELSDSEKSRHILNSAVIRVEMNAILTTYQNGIPNGGIAEDGTGGFTHWGTYYRLKDSKDLASIRRIFRGHTFESYINIRESLANHQLNIRYAVNGTPEANAGCTSIASVGNDYSLANYTENGVTIPYVLYANHGLFTSSGRILNPISLLDPDDIHLSKTGYHLIHGKEWIYDNRYFTHTSYMPKDITAEVGYADQNIYMYANWQANTFSVNYDANGGTGSVLPTTFIYDQPQNLNENIFYKAGYKLKSGAEWNTKPDGTGTSYASGQHVSNLSTENEAVITLYANWEPEIYTITLDVQGGTSGDRVIYEKYGVGFYSNPTCTKAITAITPPQKPAHLYKGYYTGVLGAGNSIISSEGTLLIGNTYYTSNETIYAHYDQNEFTITFDKQGGRLGTDSAHVYSGHYFPAADGPVKNGYTFKGYYTDKNGGGTQYYNENMASGKRFDFNNNLTLYAYWVDNTAPSILLKTNADKWTNQTITLTAEARDYGLGISTVSIYKIADDGSLILVAEQPACNGISFVSLPYENPIEGIIRYKAIATDLAGNTAGTYNVVYYDITPPKGETLNKSINGTTVFFKVNVTDVNVQ